MSGEKSQKIRASTEEVRASTASGSKRLTNIAFIGAGRTGSSLIWSLFQDIPGASLTEPKEFLRINTAEELKGVVHRNSESVLMTHVKPNPGDWDGSTFILNKRSELRLSIGQAIELIKSVGFGKYVHLQRKNHVRHYLSVQRAWGRHADPRLRFRRGRLSRARKHPLTVNADDLRDWIRRCTEVNSAIAAALEPEDSLDLTYETYLMDDYSHGFERLLRYSGLDYTGSPKTNLKRTNPFLLKEVILNYEDLVTAAAGESWSWMLEQ